ncbi:cysteine desulfurase NifS [Candidatus Parcubacteria bacterium]|nr:MAG: cysteine desulfurase NifS [Candidatus Parcubacteria bacterium]
MNKHIYLDHASTTPTDPRVVKAMEPYWNEKYGNPSSLYRLSLASKQAIIDSREKIAKVLNCQPDEIIFTGGGTESINLAIKGSVWAAKKPVHIITSKVEHPAVLNSCQRLNSQGHKLSILPVDRYGFVSLEDVKKAIKDDTLLVSIMMANNEIGTIQPIQEIGVYIEKLNKERVEKGLDKIYFHTDACQAAGALDIDVKKLHVDMITINGSKIYGPKGVGVLYLKPGTKLIPIIDGGGQEKKMRSGTENVPGIVGMAEALDIAYQEKEKENKRQIELRDWFIEQLLKTIDKSILNGDPKKRLPNNINISFLDIEGEAVLLYLDEIGVMASTGSACTSSSLEPSHVIRALGAPYEVAHGSIRFTMGKSTTKKDLQHVLENFPEIVKKLRQASPANVDMAEVEKTFVDAERKILDL